LPLTGQHLKANLTVFVFRVLPGGHNRLNGALWVKTGSEYQLSGATEQPSNKIQVVVR
jgi:hypothetical protein